MLVLIALAAAAAAPHPSELKLYKDWVVGCDNGRSCQAVGLIPHDHPDDAITMTVERGPEAEARPVIRFALDGAGAKSIAADGKRLEVRLVTDEESARVDAADVPAAVAALRSAARLTVLGAKGENLGSLSLAGASAALLYMDDRQLRVGTTTALARPGPRPAATIPAPPVLPVVRAARLAVGPGLALAPQRVKALRKAQGCEIEEIGGPDEVEIHKLDARRSLVLLACGSGAYNVTTVVLIAEGQGKTLAIRPARLEGSKDGPMLVNAGWVAEKGLLTSYAKGRGLGDCGQRQDYVWDGASFRLVGQWDMDECRGSRDYIRTWRARIVR